MIEDVEKDFKQQIAEHELMIIKDDGLYRHLRFKRPGTTTFYFNIVTWPGFLAYSGDMGCFVFSRLEDMLTFFRGHFRPDFSYWAEKVQAVDKSSDLEKFSEKLFRQRLAEDLEEYIQNRYSPPDDLEEGEEEPATEKATRELAITELRRAVQEEILGALEQDDSGHAAVRAAVEFVDENCNRCPFPDFYEHHLTAYTYRFLWCCLALPWAISLYDKAKAEEERKDDPRFLEKATGPFPKNYHVVDAVHYVGCPRCKAKPGYDCRTPSGRRVRLHTERFGAYIKSDFYSGEG